jgi:hypothetical protein
MLKRADLDVAGGECLGNKVRLVARMQLVAEIFDVPFDGARRDSELLGALLGRQAKSNALKDLALTLGQSDKVFLLTRDVHHQPLFAQSIFHNALIGLVITALQLVERAVPISDKAGP